jgi:hypothetical protein
MIEAAEFVLFSGVLLSVLCNLWLRASCPSASHAAVALFSYGSVPPYRGVRSLRPRFLLPWVGLPDLSGCRPSTNLAIVCIRAAAALSFLALLALGAIGIFGDRA